MRDNCPLTKGSLNISNFENPYPRPRLNGSATFQGETLLLTPGTPNARGSSFERFSFNTTHSFSTYFVAHATNNDVTTPSMYDGFAFVLHWAATSEQDVEIALGTDGLAYEGIDNSLAIEFANIYDNPEILHIGFLSDGIINAHVEDTSTDIPIQFINQQIHVWIEYNAPQTELFLYVAEEPVRPETPSLRGSVDLQNYATPHNFAMGFIAGTQQSGTSYAIEKWELSTADSDQTDNNNNNVGDICE